MPNKPDHPYKCLDCKFLWLDSAQPGYSELTPSSPMTWSCMKNHFEFDEYHINMRQHIKSILEIGNFCDDFQSRD